MSNLKIEIPADQLVTFLKIQAVKHYNVDDNYFDLRHDTNEGKYRISVLFNFLSGVMNFSVYQIAVHFLFLSASEICDYMSSISTLINSGKDSVITDYISFVQGIDWYGLFNSK